MTEEISIWKAILNLLKALWGVWQAKQAQDTKEQEETQQRAREEATATLEGVRNEIKKQDAEIAAAGYDAHATIVRQCRELED